MHRHGIKLQDWNDTTLIMLKLFQLTTFFFTELYVKGIELHTVIVYGIKYNIERCIHAFLILFSFVKDAFQTFSKICLQLFISTSNVS